ncbi:hypothetical protein RND81_13G105400 [Saponaria officinalis]|uniref:Reverse transcriptase domain-containing protein n=1 Tax=Saponaria officinalis TaxID=3572 RepID=A0AAW1H4G6_SAPOF
MEVLSRGLRLCDQVPHFSFHPQCLRVRLNHLIFADDLLIFTRGDFPSVMAVVQCPHSFAKCSGLVANPDKTHIYFGGVDVRVQHLILSSTRFSVGTLPFKYLGLPLSGSRLKVCQFQSLVDKFARKIHHWTSTHLSHAGKLRLIDSILYSNLVYWCSVFKLPLGVVHKLEACSRNFNWGASELGSGIHWMQWTYFTKPRCEGGVGIKEILSWNKALLLKWLWKLVVRPPSLWLNWTEEYLLNGNSIWTVQMKATASWVWSDILRLRDDFMLLCGGPDAARRLLMDRSVPGSQKFSLGAAYDFFRAGVPCAKKIMVLWEPFALPKYNIVGWQAYGLL